MPSSKRPRQPLVFSDLRKTREPLLTKRNKASLKCNKQTDIRRHHSASHARTQRMTQSPHHVYN